MKKLLLVLFATLTVLAKAQLCFNSVQNINAIPNGAYAIINNDFNGDGMLDIMSANWGSNNISLFVGNGEGNFASPVSFAAGCAPVDLVATDFNGDGKLDIATANDTAAGYVCILFGNGLGSYSVPIKYPIGPYAPWRITMADLNSDGKLDIVTANRVSKNISVLLGTGNGTFGAATSYTVGAYAQDIATADFNNDGKLDVVVSNYDQGGVSILLGNGSGGFNFGTYQPIYYGSDPTAVLSTDYNNDGNADIAVLSAYGVGVFLGHGNGSFSVAQNYGTGGGDFMTQTDFNSDGILDIAISYNQTNNVSVILGTGTGSFVTTPSFANGISSEGITSADFNRDGNLDLVTANTNTLNLSVFLGEGAKDSVSFGTNYSIGSSNIGTGSANNYFILCQDFNRDNKLDVAVASTFMNDITILLNTGNAGFTTASTCTLANTALSIASVVSAYFNADTIPDIALLNTFSSTSSSSTSSVTVFLGTGTGQFNTAASYSTNVVWNYMLSADFNNDHVPDIITATNAGAYVIKFGAGNGTFSSSTIGNVATYGFPLASLACADFNNDGNIDLVGATGYDMGYGTQDLSIKLGNGNGAFGAVTTFSTPYGSGNLVCADFNKDGNVDIATEGQDTSGTNILAGTTIFLGTGTGSFTYTDFLLNFYYSNLSSADINSDSLADLISLSSTNVYTAISDGTGHFKITPYSFQVENSYALTTGDFNNDGKNDIITAYDNLSVSKYGTSLLLNCTSLPNDVWPGDANEDLMVNNADLLEIGLQYNQSGHARSSISNTWQGFECIDWNDTLNNGKDAKYADCNGDGTINMADTLAINLNYTAAHNQRVALSQTIFATDPDIYVQYNKTEYSPGDTVLASLFIGSNLIPQTVFYGTAFQLQYNKNLIKNGTEKFWFNNSWVGNINQNAIKFDKLNTNTGVIDACLVRITHTNTTGYGKIATLQFVLLSSLNNEFFYIKGDNAIKTDSNGVYTSLTTSIDSVLITNLTTSVKQNTFNKVKLYPNPAQNNFTIETSSNEKQNLQVFDVNGKQVLSQTITGKTNIDASNLAEGVYNLSVQNSTGVINKRLVIVR